MTNIVTYRPSQVHKERKFVVPIGLTIEEMLNTLPNVPGYFWHVGRVTFNGHEIKREYWRTTRYKPGVKVCAEAHLHGPGGAGKKSPFAMIAAIALLLVTAAISGGALAATLGPLFLAGKIGAIVASLAVGLLGGLAISALSPPPVANAALTNGSGHNPRQLQPASLSGNVVNPNGYVPKVVGERDIFPPLAAQPIVEQVGKDSIVEAVFILDDAHNWRNIRVNGIPIANIPFAEYQIVQAKPGDAIQTLVQRYGSSDGVSLTWSDFALDSDDQTKLANQNNPNACIPQWEGFSTRTGFDEFWVPCEFNQGLIDTNAPKDNVIAKPTRWRFRIYGDQAWINGPEIHFAGAGGFMPPKTVKFITDDAPEFTPQPPSNIAPYLAFSSNRFWTADARFRRGGDIYLGNDNYDKAGVRNVFLTDDAALIYIGAAYKDKRLEIQAIGGLPYSVNKFVPRTYAFDGVVRDLFSYFSVNVIAKVVQDQNGINAQLTTSATTSIVNQNPIQTTEFSTLSLRLRNRRVDSVSATCGMFVKEWRVNAHEFRDLTVSKNPANHYYNAIANNPSYNNLPLSLIDFDSIGEYWQWCIAHNLEINAIFEGATIGEVMQACGSVGFGRPTQCETWGMTIDKDYTDEPIVQTFSSRNMSSFYWEQLWQNFPDGLLISYKDEAFNYADKTVVVPAPGFTALTAKNLDAAQYSYQTNGDQVAARANFDIMQAYLRPRFYYAEVGVRILRCRFGSLLLVQHDTLTFHSGGGNIIDWTVNGAGKVDTVTLDAVLDQTGNALLLYSGWLTTTAFTVANRLGCSIQLPQSLGGGVLTKELSVSPTKSNVFNFRTPFLDPTNMVSSGRHMTVGPLGQEALRLICRGITFKRNYTATVVMVDEAPALPFPDAKGKKSFKTDPIFTFPALDFYNPANSQYLGLDD